MTKPTRERRLYNLGCRVAERGASLWGHPFAIVAVTLFCAAWFLFTGEKGEALLSLILSVAAITLMQMVLNQQSRSEAALHLKIDELVLAVQGARNELAGIENKTEEELEAMRRTEAEIEQVATG